MIRLMSEQRLKVAPAVYNAKNHHVHVLDRINNDVFADGKASALEAELRVALPTKIWVPCQEVTLFCDGIDQVICS